MKRTASFVLRRNAWRRKCSTTRQNCSVRKTPKKHHHVFAIARHSSSSSTTAAATPGTWNEWFSQGDISARILYENPWDLASTRLTPLAAPAPTVEEPPAVDLASRHAIQLLLELHHKGRPLGQDRITTARCNAVLAALAALKPKTMAVSDRAYALFETMRIFEQDVRYQQSPKRQEMEWPVPNRDTYHWILEIDSTTPGPASLPRRTKELVEQMETMYQEMGAVDLKPTAMHWNHVLLAWQHCLDWERPVHAARLLLDLRAKSPDLVSEMSYIIVLRLCGYLATDEKEQELGSNVAVRLWQELVEVDPNKSNQEAMISHMYAMFLQAFRYLPDRTEKEKERRREYFEKSFEQACQQGKVNEVVLQEFLVHVRSINLFRKFLGPYGESIRGLSPKEAVSVLMKQIPQAWISRADPVRGLKPEQLPRE